jgi:hypothetical protein
MVKRLVLWHGHLLRGIPCWLWILYKEGGFRWEIYVRGWACEGVKREREERRNEKWS